MDHIITIGAQALRDKMEKSSYVTVINVLDEAYYQDCHITDSMNIPLDKLEESVKDWDRNKQIVVYCASHECHLSRKACEKLKNMSFKDVLAYEGGIREWKEKGYPREGACQLDY
jgi:rhodanese-related sulfurtransferase